ncbi:ribonuclease domain-containing protein [Parvibium lacunae]|uniref:Ribonuclease n=1 Tax=Parvibium lacunae TaxID=1888893 RepID=A0A368L196_9BURK|nr:ribonuclease domain-containing protein [Parvibium lacunae]RCS57347.1 ribonuclease [Parvibium lacunae]
MQRYPALARIFLQSVTCFLLLFCSTVSVTAHQSPEQPVIASITWATLPPEAQQTLQLIRQGGPFPYTRDGTVFQNFEQRLPRQRRGYYTEYTVPTPGLSHRGARRIVAGAGKQNDPKTSGEYYYTADHYQRFLRIQQVP